MKYRNAALVLCLCMTASLFACSKEPNGQPLLNGVVSEYSATVAHASVAANGVEITESGNDNLLKNQTAQLQFSKDGGELKSLTSLQTGETLLKNTVITTLTAEDGRIAKLTGGVAGVEAGQYGITHRNTEEDAALPARPDDAKLLKEFTMEGSASPFSTLINQVSSEFTGSGMKILSEGANRAQFGARYLNLELGNHDHYYLSITLRSHDLSGISVFFSTAETSLTERTDLGKLSLSNSEEFVTLTAEITNSHWNGTLQTLLFRLPEGETGTVEIARIALLVGDDTVDEDLSQTHWTIYSDRIYFSQKLSFHDRKYTAVTTEITVNEKTCNKVIENDHFIALSMIDGSVLGFIRPTSGAILKTEKGDGVITLRFEWDLTEESPSLAFRIYLNYTETAVELEKAAREERFPLSADNFVLEGAELEGYDATRGLYRFKRTGDEVRVTVKKNTRTIYLYLPPADGTAWKLCDKDGNRLPVFCGTVFPICSDGNEISVLLKTERLPTPLESPAFFPNSGLNERSLTTTSLNGLCAQSKAVYTAADGSYTVTLTATKLEGGIGTIYDIRYDFLTRKSVSDLRNAFPFFSFELTYGFDRYSYRNSEGESVGVSAGSENYSYLGSMPYVTLSGDTESAGWLITKSAMTAGGTTSTALPILRYAEVSEENTNKLYLSFDEKEVDFIPGDTLTAQVIRLETDDEATLNTLRDAGNFRVIQTEQKSVGSFTVLGMEDSTIVQIEGFDDYKFPKINANGEAYHPTDYHVYVDAKGFYGFAFSVPTGTKITVK